MGAITTGNVMLPKNNVLNIKIHSNSVNRKGLEYHFDANNAYLN